MDVDKFKSLKPLRNEILVKVDEEKKETKSGILLPKEQDNMPSTGEVIDVGPGIYNDAGKFIEAGVNVGDRIAFLKNAGYKFETEDQGDVEIVSSEHVLAVIG